MSLIPRLNLTLRMLIRSRKRNNGLDVSSKMGVLLSRLYELLYENEAIASTRCLVTQN